MPAGDHLERLARAQLQAELGEQVDELGADAADLLGAVVAQHPVDAVQRLRDVLALLPIDAVEVLAGVQVMQRDRARLERTMGGGDGRCRERRRECPARQKQDGTTRVFTLLRHWRPPRSITATATFLTKGADAVTLLLAAVRRGVSPHQALISD